MARILPERTVEAWTTAYITRWFPSALIWAPTQRKPLNWDAALGLPGHRYFVFEYKGVEPGTSSPVIGFNISQLQWYLAENARLGASIFWYLLPCWTFVTDEEHPLPFAASYRTIRAAYPSEPPDPKSAMDAPDVRLEEALARGCESYFYVADPTDIWNAVANQRGTQSRSLPVGDVPEVARGVTLEHFLPLVSSHRVGASWGELLAAARDHVADHPASRPGGNSATGLDDGGNATVIGVPDTGATQNE